MDQQRFMDILAHHGPAVLKTIVESVSNDNSEDNTDEQSLFELMKNKFEEIGKPSGTHVPKPNCFLKPDPLPAMPPELYRESLNNMERRRLFFKHLHRRDILYLQVLNTKDKESYKCLVLAKHGDLSQLDDLSLVIHFPKLPPELAYLGGELEKFDIIRGAFWSCSLWERKLFVTLDTRIFSEEEKEKLPKLGRVARTDLPHYVRSKKVGMTYAGYIMRSMGYKLEVHCLKQIHECLGFDTNRNYSFFDVKTYPATETYVELKKKLIPDPSTQRLHKSFEYFRVGNMYKALIYANKAISLNPDNIQARVTRGTVYAVLGKIKKAFTDTVDSLKLDPKHEGASKQMAELLVSASKTHLIKKNYIQWHEYLVMATSYNSKNREAQELLSCAKFETSPTGVAIPIQPALPNVLAIYARLVNDADKRRTVKQYRKQRKRKRKQYRHRHRSSRRKSKQRPMVAQPIPTTTTSRRQVFLRPSSPVFRRPFPPRPLS